MKYMVAHNIAANFYKLRRISYWFCLSVFILSCHSDDKNRTYMPIPEFARYDYLRVDKSRTSDILLECEYRVVISGVEELAGEENGWRVSFGEATPCSDIFSTGRKITMYGDLSVDTGNYLSDRMQLQLLKMPFKIGKSWEDDYFNYEITDKNKISFEGIERSCIVVRMVNPEKESAPVNISFCEDVGIYSVEIQERNYIRVFTLVQRSK